MVFIKKEHIKTKSKRHTGKVGPETLRQDAGPMTLGWDPRRTAFINENKLVKNIYLVNRTILNLTHEMTVLLPYRNLSIDMQSK